MRTWVKLIVSQPDALRDAREHLSALADEEDRLSKAESLEKLHYQRGMVDGIRRVLFILTSNTK